VGLIESFASAVAEAVAGAAVPWVVEVVEETGSTNSDLMARVRAGECSDYAVMVGLAQTGGRGRLARGWSTPPGLGVAVSMMFPLDIDPSGWGLVPLATGVAVARALGDLGVGARLKWPNDVLVSGRKIAGILVEATPRAAVAGVGINVAQTGEDLADVGGTSVAIELAAETTREAVVAAVLRRMGEVVTTMRTAAGREALLGAYRELSDTIGREVRVWLGERDWTDGRATGVADDGRLLVETGGEVRAFAAGDVVHLR